MNGQAWLRRLLPEGYCKLELNDFKAVSVLNLDVKLGLLDLAWPAGVYCSDDENFRSLQK